MIDTNFVLQTLASIQATSWERCSLSSALGESPGPVFQNVCVSVRVSVCVYLCVCVSVCHLFPGL